ncbi:hypothetical protein GCM10027404_22390 [Arthrobacter tumbae]|uniref:hypothetical protein n=1 Tax=Arthrobacter tumbae TaxID=163874 RepID=UPI00195926F7|nr:hypothetical protein [Arthrobacter tumbae]MBM7781812.1 hypothetical protein [Arthrobacter tumbae]
MGVEFRLGYNNHLKVEDFVTREAAAIGAIALHVSGAVHQNAVAEAAREAGVSVTFDPRTERLASPGYGMEKIPGYTGIPYNLQDLAADPGARAKLVASVLEAHPAATTLITPPSFFIAAPETALLNLGLAEMTRTETSTPVRPVITFGSRCSHALVRNVAEEYARAGFTAVDVRFSPLGGEKESIRKIRAVYKNLDAFKGYGFEVTLGQSGNIGQAAVALGHANHYSVGVAQLESVNHARTINAQSKPPILDEDGKKKPRPSQEGVYLPGLALTVSRATGTALLGHTDIRTRIGCRIGPCASSIKGPLDDNRGHYLHARAAEMQQLMAQPAAWRVKSETDRLARALELRKLINRKYLGKDEPQLNTRTLESILGQIGEEQAAAVA